jgi:hypothetical protein
LSNQNFRRSLKTKIKGFVHKRKLTPQKTNKLEK